MSTLECSKALPVVRVSSGTTFESHFFAGNVKRAGIHLHSGAPYLPATLDSSKGMMLQYWHDPACPLEITLSVNRIASLGTIVTRYRSIIASWPILVLLGAIRHLLVRSTSTVHTVTTQLKTFDGSLKSFLMCESCWWLSAAVTFGAVQASMLHIGVLPAALVNLLLGTRHLLLLLLIPAFLAFATCAVVISNVVLRTMVSLSSKAVSVAFSRSTSEVK